MDYYGLMVYIHRLKTAALAAALLVGSAVAGTHNAATPVPSINDQAFQKAAAQNSAATAQLDAELFYEILLGEMTTRSGEAGAGFALMLEAARRSNDEKVYKRAVELAAQARSGDAALAAAKAWKEAWPQSQEANRYVLQLLIALNRIADTAGPLQQALAQTAPHSKTAVLQALPQMYGRASDKSLAATLVEKALSKDLESPQDGAAAWTTVGQMRLLAKDRQGALSAALRASKLDTQAEGPILLALELLDNGQAEADALVRRYFEAKPAPELRVVYARVLIDLKRNSDALQQLQIATRDKPSLTEAWFIQAALQLDANALEPAQASLKQFMALAAPEPASDKVNAALNRAYLLSAQISEKQGDADAAEAWLNRIQNAPDLLGAQVRRAALLARHGKLTQARALIHSLPANTPDDERIKLVAEAQLLRDAGQLSEALAVQAKAVAQFPQDNDLLYDQAMLAEKAGQHAAMERMLRQLIAQDPDYYHAYNALGYSLADRGVQLQEAKELVQKALTFAPADPFITDSLGWVEFRLGNPVQALQLLESAFKIRPDAEIAAHLGEVLWSTGQKQRAREVLATGQQLSPDSETLKETIQRLGAGR